MSPCAYASGLPLSSDSSSASSDRFALISSASVYMSPARFDGLSLPHGPSAARAALTARSTSAAPAWATSQIGSPVAGSIVSKLRPSPEGTCSPPIQWPCGPASTNCRAGSDSACAVAVAIGEILRPHAAWAQLTTLTGSPAGGSGNPPLPSCPVIDVRLGGRLAAGARGAPLHPLPVVPGGDRDRVRPVAGVPRPHAGPPGRDPAAALRRSVRAGHRRRVVLGPGHPGERGADVAHGASVRGLAPAERCVDPDPAARSRAGEDRDRDRDCDDCDHRTLHRPTIGAPRRGLERAARRCGTIGAMSLRVMAWFYRKLGSLYPAAF